MTMTYSRKPTRLELIAHGTPFHTKFLLSVALSVFECCYVQVEVVRLLTEAGAEMERPTGGRFQRGSADSVGWLLEASMKLADGY